MRDRGRPAVLLFCALVFVTVGTGYARLPPPSEEQKAEAEAARVRAAEAARKEAEALTRAQDRVVAHYKRGGVPAPAPAVETLACSSGNDERHARIGVELIGGKVSYFAFYSRAAPRSCSIEVKRGSARWEDHGATSRVTLPGGRGSFLIDGRSGSYRFVFRGIDRRRYCGMSGRINGTLTIVRGQDDCILDGVLDGHAG